MHTTRRDRRIQEARHDPYRDRAKRAQPIACPQCGAVLLRGRWTWQPPPDHAREALCPACIRSNDDYPAGVVTLRGGFLTAHQAEIMGLMRNEETQAKAEHPLSRIMKVEPQAGGIVISTTDTHLAQRLGEAVRHAYQGELTVQFAKDTQFVRVTWERA